MTKEQRNYIKQEVKNLDTNMLKECIYLGFTSLSIASIMSNKKKFVGIGKELYLLQQELKQRGIALKKVKDEEGVNMSFVPYTKPDLHAKADVTMTIPTFSELMSMPLPTDLPKHGYLTIYLP